MDKDLLRIVIIAIGGTVILAMVLWSIFKTKRKQRKIDFYDNGNPLDNIDQSLVLNTDNDEFDIVPLGSALGDEIGDDPVSVASERPAQSQNAQPQIKIPPVIQFSIVAKTDQGFNGADLLPVFQSVGLEYGSMKVFERFDAQRQVDFTVASMVEPGLFPAENELDQFNTPGIVFYLQPGELGVNTLAIFDQFIQTINLLAADLDGTKLDHHRQVLTSETIQQFRDALGE